MEAGSSEEKFAFTNEIEDFSLKSVADAIAVQLFRHFVSAVGTSHVESRRLWVEMAESHFSPAVSGPFFFSSPTTKMCLFIWPMLQR